MYLGNASSDSVRHAMRQGKLGQMVTPAEGRTPLDGVVFAADNGCFSAKGAIDPDRWLEWLAKTVNGREEYCLFAVAPDLFQPDLGRDMGETSLHHSRKYLADIRALGVPAAVVAQNGLTPRLLAPYWGEFDVLFLGGCVECPTCQWVPGGASWGLVSARSAAVCWTSGRWAAKLSSSARWPNRSGGRMRRRRCTWGG